MPSSWNAVAIAVSRRPNGTWETHARRLSPSRARVVSDEPQTLSDVRPTRAMAYDEVLAQRIHDLIDGEPGVTSRKMFGGLGFMVEGHMAVAAAAGVPDGARRPGEGAAWVDGDAVSRWRCVAPDEGWLLVDPAGAAGDEELQLWVDRGVDLRPHPPAE